MTERQCEGLLPDTEWEALKGACYWCSGRSTTSVVMSRISSPSSTNWEGVIASQIWIMQLFATPADHCRRQVPTPRFVWGIGLTSLLRSRRPRAARGCPVQGQSRTWTRRFLCGSSCCNLPTFSKEISSESISHHVPVFSTKQAPVRSTPRNTAKFYRTRESQPQKQLLKRIDDAEP